MQINNLSFNNALKPDLVSIIIATKDRYTFLVESIQSLLNQTYDYLEIIIVDDGSLDKRYELISQMHDSRIIYLKQDQSGRSIARNVGMSASRGEFITFLDDDDLYLENKIEVQVNFLKQNKHLSVVYSSAECFNESKKLIHTYKAEKYGNIYKDIALYIPLSICLPTVMVKRKVLQTVGGFTSELARFEDTDLWRRISKKYEYGAIEQPLCIIRTHSENSIQNLNLKDLATEVELYVQKVLKEDLIYYGDGIILLCSNLMNHYSSAIAATRKGFLVALSLCLKSIALEYNPKYRNNFIIRRQSIKVSDSWFFLFNFIIVMRKLKRIFLKGKRYIF
jgi:glycosyltransferase involved in cell wall biosynthesis